MKIKVFHDACLKEEFSVEGFLNSIKLNEENSINFFMIDGEDGEELSPYTVKEIELDDGNILTLRISHSEVFSEAIEIIKKFKNLKICEVELGNISFEVEY